MKTTLRALALATVLIGLASTSADAQFFPPNGNPGPFPSRPRVCGHRGCPPWRCYGGGYWGGYGGFPGGWGGNGGHGGGHGNGGHGHGGNGGHGNGGHGNGGHGGHH